MSDEQPKGDDGGGPAGGRPPGSSSRRRRRGRGRGSRGAGATPAGAAPQPAAPSPPRPSGGGRSGDRGGRRGGGGDRTGGRRPQPSPAQPQAQRDLEITDEKIFQRLVEAGLNLEEEAVLQAFLYFAGEGPARRVAAQLEDGGFTTYVDPSPPGRWLVEAVSRAVPTQEHIAAMGAGLRNVARSSNGSYDGWWASEPPDEEEAPTDPNPAAAAPAPPE